MSKVKFTRGDRVIIPKSGGGEEYATFLREQGGTGWVIKMTGMITCVPLAQLRDMNRKETNGSK